MTGGGRSRGVGRDRWRRSVLAALALAVIALLAAGCGEEDDLRSGLTGSRFLLIGLDGAEWKAIHWLWEQGKLPNLRSLAEAGVSAPLTTDYGKSPVIWTTIATGVGPEVHGIVDFVIPTDRGDVPVSSTVRRVPALWNMLTRAELRVAVLGWWATWPAEPVNGVVVSDRAMSDPEVGVFPPEMAASVEDDVRRLRRIKNPFGNSLFGRRDQMVSHYANQLIDSPLDLMLVYLRSIDIVSHQDWLEFARVVEGAPSSAGARRVTRIYESVDRAIGDLVAATTESLNVVVVSDHGFEAMEREVVRVRMDLAVVLEHLGYLKRGEDGIDHSQTLVYPHDAPKYVREKKVRFSLDRAAPDGAEERRRIRKRLEADLASVTYSTGAPAFSVRDALPEEVEEGADFVVTTLTENASELLVVGGERLRQVAAVNRVTGTHTPETKGIFIAAGPDFDPGADVDGISIHALAPTLLYGLGLPAAEDFTARPWTALFSERFRSQNRPIRIATWGVAQEGTVQPSELDEELLDDLRALGYLGD